MQRLYKKNKGAITLLISVIILTLLGIVTLYTVKVNVMDQRTVANEADYQEAFTMAEAGLDFVIQRLFTDVFNNPTSDEHLEYSITRRKTDGSPANEMEASFAVKIGCKRGDADEIVPCSHDNILRSQSTYIKDGGLDADYAPTEIPGAPIYDIESTGYSANGSSEVTVRRQMTREPVLNGVSSVSLIVDGDIHTGDGDYHIRPSYSGSEPVAIWASGEVIMRNDSAICTNRHGFIPFLAVWGNRCARLTVLNNELAMRGAPGTRVDGANADPSLGLPNRNCAWQGIYAKAGIRQSYNIREVMTLWTHSCELMFYEYNNNYPNSARSNTERLNIAIPNIKTGTLKRIENTNIMPTKARNVVIDGLAYFIHKTVKQRPNGGGEFRKPGKRLKNGDTMLRSYDTSNKLYRAILPYAKDFADQPFPGDLFNYTFGVPRADWETIKDKAEKRGQLRANCNDLTTSSGDRYILWWITGNCTLNVGQKIGTRNRPVVLVIDDARLQMLAGSSINGRIFLFNNPDNTAEPSARFVDVPTSETIINGGLTSDVGDIEIEAQLNINSYAINRYAAPIEGDNPRPALAEFNRRNYDFIDIPGSWRDY